MVGYSSLRIFLSFAINPVIAFGTPREKQTNFRSGPLCSHRRESAALSRADVQAKRTLFPLSSNDPIIANAGHESRKLARTLKQRQGWQLRIVKRRQRAFKITGLNWIVECSFAWLRRNRRLSKDYEYRVQTSETMIDLASIRLMLNRIAPCMRLFKHPLSL